MKWASAASDDDSLDQALDECICSITAEMGSEPLDLTIVFASPHHSDKYHQIPHLIQGKLDVKRLFGCSAGGIIGGRREIEQKPGLSITSARLPNVDIATFHIRDDELPDMDASPQAWEQITNTSAENNPQFILITDPFSIQSENLLMGLDYAFPNSVKIGGMASGGRDHGSNRLFLGSEIYNSGAIGLAMCGNVVIDAVVAQGCHPIGRPMRITQSQQNILLQLDDRPTLEVLRELFESLSDRDQSLARHSLFLGVVMDKFQEAPELGDFLIRNILGMDPRSGALAIGEPLNEGQLVQFHLRDAQTSAKDLSALLAQYRHDSKGQAAEGALLFSCLGRGVYLYGHPNHDSQLFLNIVGDIPLAGFFCNGEIGPVQGTTYLHGYTSSFGIFRPRDL